MLALQVCGVTLSFVSTLPSPAWQQVTEAAYGCPVRLVQHQQTVPWSAFAALHGAPDGVWRVLPQERWAQAQPGDGVLLPGSPLDLLRQPGLKTQLLALKARGVALVLNAPDARALPALATTYAGYGLPPGAVWLRQPPQNIASLPAGTYLMNQIGGVPLLPRQTRLGEVQIIPYLPESSDGQRATPDAHRTTLPVKASLSWTFGAQHYASGVAPQGWARTLALLMPLGWLLGRLTNFPLPSLIFTLSSSVSWVVLGLLLVVLLLVVRHFLRRLLAGRREAA